MAKRNKKQNPNLFALGNLTATTRIWWFLNAVGFIQVVIQLMQSTGTTIFYDNLFTHFLYNITSVVLIVPYFAVLQFYALFFGWQETLSNPDLGGSYLPFKVLMATFLVSFIVNYIIARLLTLPIVLSVYRQSLGRNKIILWIVAIAAVLIFATH